MTFPRLLQDIRACTSCVRHLPCGVRPVVQAHPAARLRIIGQAPGKRVHETGIPWNDQSGDRLRQWLGLDKTVFYDASKVALIPMGFCYPGTGPSGDLPPRPECAPLWHDKLAAQMPEVRLTLLVGQYAQGWYLGKQRRKTLGETVKAWRSYMALGLLPLVHPSPRNQLWLHKNRWFEQEVIPELQRCVAALW